MINCIIVDDEIHSIETLKWKIANCASDVVVKESFSSSQEALHFLKNNSIDLVFLDIEMPNMNGFELLEYLDQVDFSIIFTTAYDEYALRAIKLSALDYLLKPIDINELKEAINKQRKAIDQKVFKSNYNNFLDNQNLNVLAQRISICSKDKIEFLVVGEILYCKSDSNYTEITLKDGSKRWVSKTLKEFDTMLTGKGFFRSHNSYLINMHFIREIQKTDGGSVLMVNNEMLPLSRNRKQDLIQLMQ